jgi:hypothetical protein
MNNKFNPSQFHQFEIKSWYNLVQFKSVASPARHELGRSDVIDWTLLTNGESTWKLSAAGSISSMNILATNFGRELLYYNCWFCGDFECQRLKMPSRHMLFPGECSSLYLHIVVSCLFVYYATHYFLNLLNRLDQFTIPKIMSKLQINFGPECVLFRKDQLRYFVHCTPCLVSSEYVTHLLWVCYKPAACTYKTRIYWSCYKLRISSTRQPFATAQFHRQIILCDVCLCPSPTFGVWNVLLYVVTPSGLRPAILPHYSSVTAAFSCSSCRGVIPSKP